MIENFDQVIYDFLGGVPYAITGTGVVVLPADDPRIRVQEAKLFLDRLYGCLDTQRKVYGLQGDYYTYLCKFKPFRAMAFKVSDPEERQRMAEVAIKVNDKGFDVYFGVNLTDKPFEGSERPSAEDIVAQVAVVSDIDCTSNHHNSGDYVPDTDTAISLLPFKPSLVVSTGGGIHAYNLFTTPLFFETAEDRTTAEDRNKQYIGTIRDRAKDLGYKGVDGIGDLPRVTRMVGTINSRESKLCKVIEKLFVWYSPADISEKLTAIVATTTTNITVPKARAANPVNSDAVDNPDLAEAMGIASVKHLWGQVLDYNSEWLPVMTTLFELGREDLADELNRSDPRPDKYEDIEKVRRRKLGNGDYDWYTIIGIAKRYGFDSTAFAAQWYKEHPEHSNRNYGDSVFVPTDKPRNISAELAQVLKDIEALEATATAAVETLNNVSTFDADNIFTEEVITAAAYVRLYDRVSYNHFKADVVAYSKTTKLPGQWRDLEHFIIEKADEISTYSKGLIARKNRLQGMIDSQAFFTADGFPNYMIPTDYTVSARGVYKLSREKVVQICSQPVIIKEQYYDIDSRSYELVLSYRRKNGWCNIPAKSMSDIFDHKKIISLADNGLDVSSTTARDLVEYLQHFKNINFDTIPTIDVISKCGWHDKDTFIDPRTIEGKPFKVKDSDFVSALQASGSLEEWRRVYLLVKPSAVARLIVAACIATPLLKVLNERNFMLYVYTTTRSGKTTALNLGASAVGSSDIAFTFDATKNGLAGVAASRSDYSLIIDEKQVSDNHMKERLQELVYSLGGGKGRIKLKKDSTVRLPSNFRTIAVANGETPLLEDNATGGANTRCLQIHTTDIIVAPDIATEVFNLVPDNYGLVLPRFIEELVGNLATWRKNYTTLQKQIADIAPDILPEYVRYLSLLMLADCILNISLDVPDAADVSEFVAAIIPLIPTKADISDTSKEKDFVMGFIAENQKCFIGANNINIEDMSKVYGKLTETYTAVSAAALKVACKSAGFDYKKVVADLAAEGFFNDVKAVNTKLGDVQAKCYRIPHS